MPDGSDNLPFEPSMPYSATEGTQLVFTIPFQSDWYVYEEGNVENEYIIQVQVPESIQNSYEIVWPYEDGEDPEALVQVDGTLSFTMPAENITLNIDLIENPNYTAPPVETELTVVNNLPEGYTCEVGVVSIEDGETLVPIEDTTNPISLHENDIIGVKVLNENSEVVNYYPDETLNGIRSEGIISDYDGAHENVGVMQHSNVYCSIEGEFNDEITTSTLDYSIVPQRLTGDFFGCGESFYMPPIPLTLTIQKP